MSPADTVTALAGRSFDRARARGDQMKDADVPQVRHRRRGIVSLRTDDAERLREARIEENRSGQAHRARHVSKRITGRRAHFGAPANDGGVCDIEDTAMRRRFLNHGERSPALWD